MHPNAAGAHRQTSASRRLANGGGRQSARFETSEPPTPAAVNSRSRYAFSSQPLWPQWHASVIMPLASSQWVEQNFLPAGAMHLHAI
jgi:hypothetical protein